MQHRLQHLQIAGAAERAAARDRFMEHDPEGEDVAAGVERPPGHLLRRHVRDGAGNRPRTRRRGRRLKRRAVLLQEFRQTEISQLGVAAPRDKDVLRLDVAVEDARLVRERQPVADAGQQLDDLPPRACAVVQPVPQRAAVDQFGDEVLTSVGLAGVVHRDDVRVIER